MTPGARIAAAIEVMADINTRRRPAADALRDWGLSHRFAGSKDRAAIASLVYDCLRRRLSSAWVMGSEAPRAIALGMLARQLNEEQIVALFSGAGYAPPPLADDELGLLAGVETRLADAPLHVRGDFPEWIAPKLLRAFGDDAAVLQEMEALGARAPIDIRVNTLKAEPAKVLEDLGWMGAEPGPGVSAAIRIPAPRDGRGPSLQSEEGYVRGWFEVQDAGSQMVAAYSGAAPGETVVDLCAGAGGKTLTLAAMMRNEGRLLASDVDSRRLAAIYDRLDRSGATCVDVRAPRGRWRPDGPDPLEEVAGQADLVLVDAPCTGTGTWRRNPDAKWRLRPGSLSERLKDQQVVLDRAASLVRPGGRIVYITCSVLPDENEDAVTQFLARRQEFAPAPLAETSFGRPGYERPGGALQLTPARTGTDGFYVATLIRH